jgi:hypothetical protein
MYMKKNPILLMAASLILVGAGCASVSPTVTTVPPPAAHTSGTNANNAVTNTAVKPSEATGGGKEGDPCVNPPPTCPAHAFQECVNNQWRCIAESTAPPTGKK